MLYNTISPSSLSLFSRRTPRSKSLTSISMKEQPGVFNFEIDSYSHAKISATVLIPSLRITCRNAGLFISRTDYRSGPIIKHFRVVEIIAYRHQYRTSQAMNLCLRPRNSLILPSFAILIRPLLTS